MVDYDFGGTSGRAAAVRMRTVTQVSAGGVPFRRRGDSVEVAIVSVGDRQRWQLPKGLVDPGETPEAAAVREAREEAGVATELLAPIDTIEYWYQGNERGERVRFHKYVHFFLLEYRGGDVSEHDREVHDARWVPVEEALTLLAFANERRVVERARDLIAGMPAAGNGAA
jgi:8-oxo-dGTP pyrophosphatase MutT (NUDIX family)